VNAYSNHPEGHTGPQSAPQPVTRNRRSLILVVDDVEGNRQLVCRRLSPFGYDLHQAESGEQALEFIRDRKPDLVLLDYMMPVMNGIDVLKVMRQDWQLGAIPVIMLTARAESDAVVAALAAGADDYVTKPIDFEVLRARIETQLAKQRSSEQLKQANAALDERATMRVMAFDELRDELEREIVQRRHAERALAETQEMVARCKACGVFNHCDVPQGGNGADISGACTQGGAAPSGEVGNRAEKAAKAARALEIVDALMRAVAAGKPVNPAMLAALRAQVADLA
jgi:DNA-binding response OmpR family regulator